MRFDDFRASVLNHPDTQYASELDIVNAYEYLYSGGNKTLGIKKMNTL